MPRGPYGTNRLLYDTHKVEMIKLRNEGYGYGTIAKKLNLPVHIVRYGTKHIPIDLNSSVTKGMLHLTKDRGFDDYPNIAERKSFLVRKRGHRCENCNLNEWLGLPIVLELHNHNASEEKAILLCPNCHSQTIDWRGRGKITPK